MRKYICIHGHFYQPPRENPWTGEVDAEESAKPFHDWNERIHKECYAANTQAPILDEKGRVAETLNNFSRISFDIGPTLLSWMRRHDPKTYESILAADAESARRYSGHGNAMAQVYNHVIMPLASKRDKVTQVVWGIRDFEFHYKRKPEGMWLSEAAVDRETLRVLSDHGIKFTVLAPHQAHRVRPVGMGRRWQTVHNESLDTRHAYRVLLDGGRQFHVFFYDGLISRAMAFQGLLYSGDDLINRLQNAFGRRDPVQLVSTATDGETFGHHHKFGEMAIAYALRRIEKQKLFHVTNYAEHLARFGSGWEAEVYERSSWSCAHGVERWRADCGCRINFEGGWNQKWRTVLRDALDGLKKTVDEVYETEMAKMVHDPWGARNDYIDVLLEGTDASRSRFVSAHAKKHYRASDAGKLWDLLEAQRFALFMYTSCGWFFDDISGIEPVQVMKFALRALELIRPYASSDPEPALVRALGHALSNVPKMGTGADIFEKFVKPARNPKSGPQQEVVHGI